MKVQFFNNSSALLLALVTLFSLEAAWKYKSNACRFDCLQTHFYVDSFKLLVLVCNLSAHIHCHVLQVGNHAVNCLQVIFNLILPVVSLYPVWVSVEISPFIDKAPISISFIVVIKVKENFIEKNSLTCRSEGTLENHCMNIIKDCILITLLQSRILLIIWLIIIFSQTMNGFIQNFL